ncbi:MAG: electron transport complex subunit RsxD [Gammaproteobacteria bacterium]|nr:electron transport complex subunit RsxD [Gammaproteobacteria bacterium]MDX5374877.1 electron transport complex subunit RsxD [Gammaproteobacteria bacterium]
MRFPTVSSPHHTPAKSVSRVMGAVMLALLPGTAAATWYFGWGVLINVVLAAGFAVALEAAMLALRGRPLRPFLTDGSAVLTAWLFALALPPLTEWWITLIGIVFAIVIAKQLYGGLGHNPFNPAMVGYVVVLVSFPREMTLWLPPEMLAETRFDFLQALSVVFTGSLPAGLSWDAITMATPLDLMKTELSLNRTIEEIRQSPLFGDFSGQGWEWIANWYAIGGFWLLFRRTIAWQIPVAMLGSLFAIATLFYWMDPDAHAGPLFHVFSGGAIIGAFFIATDPVSAATTPRGRLIYGAGIGVLTYVIRTWGGYPDGIAFAVLLMNMAAPTIDYYTRPRVFGEERHPPGQD